MSTAAPARRSRFDAKEAAVWTAWLKAFEGHFAALHIEVLRFDIRAVSQGPGNPEDRAVVRPVLYASTSSGVLAHEFATTLIDKHLAYWGLSFAQAKPYLVRRDESTLVDCLSRMKPHFLQNPPTRFNNLFVRYHFKFSFPGCCSVNRRG
jgi:hypothetical protein